MELHLTLVLLCAAAGALLLLGGLLRALRGRRRQLLQVRSYADAVERLQEIAAGISAKLGSGQQLLDELAIAAGQICDMSHVMICVLDKDPEGARVLRRVAAVRWPESYGLVFGLDKLSSIREAIDSSKPVFVSTRAPAGRSLELLHKQELESMALIPLLVEGKVIGLLSLCDARDHVTPTQERLAKLWGAQAAVILAHARLYDQAQAALTAQRQLTAQRERLSSITASIYAQNSFEETLKCIVQLVPSVLGVEGASVLMCQDAPQNLQIVACSPYSQGLVGQRIQVDAERMRQRFVHRCAGVVPSLSDLLGANLIWKSLPEVKSYVSVPLFHSDQRPLGLLIFLRHSSGPFTREQVELAQIVGARAGAAIENSRLHHQARVDARTNAMLLRELNHRVKNNLAGVAGLLEAADGDVSESSRPVLARLARRVRVMADAHQFFVAGVSAIGVTQLVEQVLASMGMAKTPAPRIELDLSAAACVQLRSDRAISLAMVLHELCYNALAHGCGVAGRLSIGGRLGAGVTPTLRLEVCDDGSASEPSGAADDAELSGAAGGAEHGGIAVAAAPSRTGIGLQLVRGLVGRELQGNFTLEPLLGGGTRAAVEFPLADDELRKMSS
jgi:two-component sensor histidine kinase